MLTYLLEVTLCWFIFYSIFFLALRKLTFFRVNRWFLLSSIVAGLLIPQLRHIDIDVYQEEVAQLAPIVYAIKDAPAQLSYVVTEQVEKTSFDWSIVLWSFYLIGLAFFLFRFVKGLVAIRSLYNDGVKTKTHNYTLVSTLEDHLPFSFFSYVFISDQVELQDEYQHVIDHELSHVEGRHSIDVIFLEIINTVFWFNPMIYLYKTALRQTHEYLADEAVLSHTSRKKYGTLLLKQSLSGLQIALTHQFFHSHIKKRINMMYQKKSGRSAWLKYALALPVLLLLFIIFSGYSQSADLDVKDNIPAEELLERMQMALYPDFPNKDKMEENGLLTTYNNIRAEYWEQPQEFLEVKALFVSFLEDSDLNYREDVYGYINSIGPKEDSDTYFFSKEDFLKDLAGDLETWDYTLPLPGNWRSLKPVVTVQGKRLYQDVDYFIDTDNGMLSVVNGEYLKSGIPIRVEFEDFPNPLNRLGNDLGVRDHDGVSLELNNTTSINDDITRLKYRDVLPAELKDNVSTKYFADTEWIHKNEAEEVDVSQKQTKHEVDLYEINLSGEVRFYKDGMVVDNDKLVKFNNDANTSELPLAIWSEGLNEGEEFVTSDRVFYLPHEINSVRSLGDNEIDLFELVHARVEGLDYKRKDFHYYLVDYPLELIGDVMISDKGIMTFDWRDKNVDKSAQLSIAYVPKNAEFAAVDLTESRREEKTTIQSEGVNANHRPNVGQIGSIPIYLNNISKKDYDRIAKNIGLTDLLEAAQKSKVKGIVASYLSDVFVDADSGKKVKKPLLMLDGTPQPRARKIKDLRLSMDDILSIKLTKPDASFDIIADDYGRIPNGKNFDALAEIYTCLLYTSPSPRDRTRSRMPSSA